jgi:hypothetical protein
MKKVYLLLVLALVLGLALSVTANGAVTTPNWVACDYTTKVEAPTNFSEGTSSYPMANFCSIKDGALVMDTNATPAAGPTYKMTVDAKAGFKMTIVVKAKVLSAFGMDFDFRAGVRERMILKDGIIELNSSAQTDATVKTTEWHTYFIAYEMKDSTTLVTKVYIDGATTPLLTGTSTKTDASGYFRFGDGSGSNGYAGAIDWIIWTYDGAFSPDQVSLPNGLALK